MERPQSPTNLNPYDTTGQRQYMQAAQAQGESNNVQHFCNARKYYVILQYNVVLSSDIFVCQTHYICIILAHANS